MLERPGYGEDELALFILKGKHVNTRGENPPETFLASEEDIRAQAKVKHSLQKNFHNFLLNCASFKKSVSKVCKYFFKKCF